MPKKTGSEGKGKKDFLVWGSPSADQADIVKASSPEDAKQMWIDAEGKGFQKVYRDLDASGLDETDVNVMPLSKECAKLKDNPKGLKACAIRDIQNY